MRSSAFMKRLWKSLVDFFDTVRWRIECRFSIRPSVVRIRHQDINPWMWYDRDHVLLYAAFQVLVDFIEQEEDLEHLKKQAVECEWESHRQAAREVVDLYHWWTVVRPARKDPFDFVCDEEPPRGMDFFKNREKYPKYEAMLREAGHLEDHYYQEDTDMLVRLMKVRGALWT